MTAPPSNGNTRLLGGVFGLATVVVGVVAMVYNDKLAAAGIITSGLGILAHAFA